MEKIYWPNGELHPEPVDGFIVYINGSSFQYVAQSKRWVRIYSSTANNAKNVPNSFNESDYVSADLLLEEMKQYIKCECGAEAVKSPFHSEYCPKYENT